MSSLFIDTHIEVVELILNKKDGSGTTNFYIGLDYWAGGTAYSSSPVIYPVLVSPPALGRSIGVNIANRHDVSFQVYGKTHFQSFGVGFLDLLQLYEPINSAVNYYYYPRAKNAAVAAVSANLRLKTKIIGYASDDISGVLNFDTREIWFNDKEISKDIRADVFSDIDTDWDGEIGSRAFGAYSSANGIVIDAPVLSSSTNSNLPQAKLFSGWTNIDYPNHAKKRVFVRSQEKRLNNEDWRELLLATDPENYIAGKTGISSGSYSPVANRALSARSVISILSLAGTDPGSARIVTAIEAGIYPLPYAWCMGFDGSSDICVGNGPAETWQPNESEDFSFTIAGWVYLSSLASAQIIACTHSGTGNNARSWTLYYDTASNRFKLQTYSTSGATLDLITANNLGAVSANVWYYLQGRLDGTANTLKIRANSGTWDSMATTGDPAQSRAGIRFGAFRTAGALAVKMNGFLQAWTFQNAAISDATLDYYYNSGAGKLYKDISSSYKEDMVAYWDFDDLIINECKDKHGSHDLKITGTPLADYGKIATTVGSEDGELSLSIYFAHYNTTIGAYEPIGSPLRQSKVDIEDAVIQAGGNCFFQIIPPLIVESGENGETYGVVVEWSNHKDQSKSMLFKDRVAVSLPTYMPTSFKYEYGEGARAWQLSNKEIELAVYVVGEGATTWDDGDSDPYNATSQQSLEAKSITLTAGQSHQEFALDFDFKIGIEGMQDDASGTFTGTGAGPLKNPASIIRLLLQAADFGLGIATGSIDTSAFSAVQTLCDDMGFSVDRSMTVKELIIDICRQSRLIFWVKRDGTLSIKFPTYTESGWTINLVESAMRADLTLMGIADDDDSNLVNSFKQPYGIDVLNLKKDAAFLRRAKTDKYTGLTEINAVEATSGDARRVALCVASQALYGKREMNEPLDMYDSAASAQEIQNYYCDRYTKKLTKAVVRIPRKTYYSTVDLFTTAQIQHSGIAATGGTGFDIRGYASDAAVTWYHDGVKGFAWAGGVVSGEVIEIVEEGPFMTVTVQTMNPF